MKAGINNLMLGNSKNSLVKIVANKNQTLEDMEARQRPSKNLYLSVTQSKVGNFGDEKVLSNEIMETKLANEDEFYQNYMLNVVRGGVKPARELTNIEQKVLENAVKEGNIGDVKAIINELQKELPPPPQMVGGTSVSLGPQRQAEEDKTTRAAIERLEKEKEFQKKLILYGGIGTGILLLVTIVVGVILIRSN